MRWALYFPTKSYHHCRIESLWKTCCPMQKKFCQRTKCDIQQEKRVIQSEISISNAKLCYLTRNVLVNLKHVIQHKMWHPKQKKVLSNENILCYQTQIHVIHRKYVLSNVNMCYQMQISVLQCQFVLSSANECYPVWKRAIQHEYKINK